ncbi:PIG-L family deacetylase [Nocardia sp. NPDC051570]|uniref:PIG-L family deacetylase n=1 Tax=Nocardia sp. NPDC051570 TaxID=3364324 RepID=UPI00379A188B
MDAEDRTLSTPSDPLAAGRGLVVLSPHLDDAALAVGALIAARAAAGAHVEVVSVFTDGPAPDAVSGRRAAFGDYATRRIEDDRAMAVLGARQRRMGLWERMFHDPALPTPLHLFRTPATLSGFTELAAIEREIAAILAVPGVDLLAPLGIGNHVDHVAVAVAAMRYAMTGRQCDRVLFYEDFNALSERWRRRHPVSRTAPYPWHSAPGWASPIAGIKMEAMSLVSRGPASSDYLRASRRPAVTWTPHIAAVALENEDAKIGAVREYRTQTRVLGGEKQISAMIRRSRARRGGEVLWRLRPGGPA